MSRRQWGLAPFWSLLVLTSGFYFFSDNEADNDLWVHVRVGLDVLAGGVPRIDPYSYTALGGSWVDHEWLLHAVFGALYQVGGDRALLIFKIAVGLATLGLLAVAVRRHASSVHARGIVLVLASAVLARGFAVRPQVLTYLFAAALWVFLDDPGWRDSGRRWWLVPFFVLWANLHGGVLLGLGMAGLCSLWMLCAGVSSRGSSRWRAGGELAMVTALGVAAALVLNPYGLGYAAYVWRELSFPHPITEWQPVAFEGAQATFFLLGAAVVASLPFIRDWRVRGWETGLALLLLGAALVQQRHTPVFALVAAPVAAEGLDAMAQRLRLHLSGGARGIIAAAIVALAAIQVVTALQRLGRDRFRIAFPAADYPVGAVQRLAAAGAPVNLAVPLEWGAYAVWHLAPSTKVSLDGRFATVYPPAVVEDNFAFFSGRDDWKRLIDAYPTEAVLAPSSSLPAIAATPGWRRAYADEVATVLVRQGSALDLGPATTVDPTARLPFP